MHFYSSNTVKYWRMSCVLRICASRVNYLLLVPSKDATHFSVSIRDHPDHRRDVWQENQKRQSFLSLACKCLSSEELSGFFMKRVIMFFTMFSVYSVPPARLSFKYAWWSQNHEGEEEDRMKSGWIIDWRLAARGSGMLCHSVVHSG